MGKKYLVWKDVNCNGINPQWIEMSGRAFAKFIKYPENKNRYFIKLLNDVCVEADVIIIEATKSEYVKWRKEYDHKIYLHKQMVGYQQISFDCTNENIDNHDLHEIIADDRVNVEDIALNHCRRQGLRQSIKRLLPQQQAIIYQFFFNSMSNQESSKFYGVSCAAITQKIKRAKSQLKNFL